MSEPNQTLVPAHPLGPTPGIRPVEPLKAPRPHLCEMPLHIGVFFDGTGNNQDWVEEGAQATQLQRRKDSNVARLFRAYPDEPSEGYFRAYVPGVGTPFEDIGEAQPRSMGAAFGAGGDGRINFGLLHVINAIHSTVSPNSRLYAYEHSIRALCRNGQRVNRRTRAGAPVRSALAAPEDEAGLRAVGMQAAGGLLLNGAGQAPQRTRFFRQACAQIAQKMAAHGKPKITEIFIDVYGFSRGATAARTFCNWLLELFDGDTLCGVPARIRFLGLFDTVASVGLPGSSTLSGGHLSWGDAPWLRVSPKVYNCVHFVAMHENRASFPVDLLRQAGALPANCHEYMFPGMHSDVGGGYTPQDQGRGPGQRDDEKLSQMALEAMYQASLSAKVPLDRALDASRTYDPFRVADTLRQAYTAFMAPRQGQRLVREWLFEYLAWRYQTRHQYASLAWHARASASDRDDLLGATRELIKDVDALALLQGSPQAGQTVDWWSSASIDRARQRVARLAREARDIHARLQTSPAVDTAAAHLFENYCHDSFAGFRPYDKIKWWGFDPVPGSWEPQGYLRWRRRYEGDDQQLVRRPDVQGDGTMWAHAEPIQGDESMTIT
jgi:hypothetical protein